MHTFQTHHKLTHVEVPTKMIALGIKVYNSNKLIYSRLSGIMQHDLVKKADGFAEVFLEYKCQVVEIIKQRGHLTMIGDRVNDTLSLKRLATE
jgi:H+-transporting ATPase